MTATGYSGTPLAKKLGIKAGTRVLPLEAPPEFRDWLGELPDDVAFRTRMTDDVDIVHVFAVRSAKLAHHLQKLRRELRQDAAVWVSWPKKVSKVPTDITEDVIRTLALPLGFVDIKVCAVTEIWSGLKLVVRKSDRITIRSAKMSVSGVMSRCPKCEGGMVQGFVLDHTHGSQGVSSWAEGAPEKSFWMGTKSPVRTLPIGAFRCERCGFLEFYAGYKFAAQ